MNASLVFLTRNEIEALPHMLPLVPLASFDDVFAVDGNSIDGTVEYFEQHGVRVIRQQVLGRGEAFRLAMQHAKHDAVIFFSPDGNEDPADIPKFLPYLEQGYDMVIASRMMKGAYNEEDSQVFRWRKWANNAFNFLANIAFRRKGPYVTDSINGFRAITKSAFALLSPDGRGYTIEYQMTIRALKKRMRIAEFPTHESSRVGGQSQAQSIPTGMAFVRLFLRELWSS